MRASYKGAEGFSGVLGEDAMAASREGLPAQWLK